MEIGYTNDEIFNEVLDDAERYVNSPLQLKRCISGIRAKHTLGKRPVHTYNEREIPLHKMFKKSKHGKIISKLKKNMPTKLMEAYSEPIALDILKNYEGFEKIEKGSDLHGTPFDFFGFKDGDPYIIELKSSLYSFNTPGEVQKRRMREILKKIKGLKVALLQIALKKGEYRMCYHDYMRAFLHLDKQAPIKPITQWIKEKM